MKYNITYMGAIALHVLIGILVFSNESLAKLYFFAAFGIFMFRIIVSPQEAKTYEILKACAYFVGAEVFLRMTKGSISYEAGKYVVILLMLIGMFYKGLSGRAWPYLLYIMFMVPSVFVASTTLSFDANFRTNIAFVLSGPVCLGVAALFCYDKKISNKELYNVLLLGLLPIITHTVYIYLYNPSVRDVLSGTASSRAAAGGFGANQVSTILGLGMLLIAIRIFVRSKGIEEKLLNIFIFCAISYRAVVTFSRGGVVTALASIIAFLVIYFAFVNSRKKNQIIGMVIVFSISIISVWAVSINQTDGLIELRYENKDHMGREKVNVTTGRKELFLNELTGFFNQPFFGIGSSRAKDQRFEIAGQGVTSHSEVSRTLAEHGVLGIAILVILIFKPLAYRARNRNNVYFFSFLCFWFLTINHSSMRIAAPALIYGLALLNVTNEKTAIPRKLPIRKK